MNAVHQEVRTFDDRSRCYWAQALDGVWPPPWLRHHSPYPEPVRTRIRKFNETLWLSNQQGTVFGRSLDVPLFGWLDESGFNSCFAYPFTAIEQIRSDAPWLLRICVNSVESDVMRSMCLMLEAERVRSSQFPRIDDELVKDDPNANVEVTITSDEIEAVAAWLPSFLSSRVQKRDVPSAPVPFFSCDANRQLRSAAANDMITTTKEEPTN